MFTIDTSITDLKIKERNLYKVFFSMNIHQVATPELSAEDAKSYVFIFREGQKYLSYIGLHFLRTDRKMYYSHSANPFSDNELPDVEEEARNFAEDLGAMLDELGLDKMSDVEKDRWMDEQDLFSSKPKPVEQPPSAEVVQVPQAEQTTPAAQPAPAVQTIPEPASVPQPAPAAQPTPALAPAPAPVFAQPAPAPQVAPEVPSASPEVSAPVPQASAPRPEPAAQSVSDPAPAPVEQTLVEEPESAPSRPQRKQAAAPRQPAVRPKTTAPVPKPQVSVDQVLEQAVKAGIVKAPQQPLKKDILSSSGVTSRDKEALARLLASF